MNNKNRISEITRKLAEQSLSISRVPSDTKNDFIGLANAKFTADYGLTLKFILEQANEYQYMKALFFDKMQLLQDKIDNLLSTVNSLKEKHEKNIPTSKRLGRRIEQTKEE